MEAAIWRAFASLGIPGLALGVLYMLFRRFHWRFPEVPQVWVGPIIVLFMAISGGIVYSALQRWAPVRQDTTPASQLNPVANSPTQPTAIPSNTAWKKALLTIQDRHELYFGRHAHYGNNPPTFTNREALMKILTRLDVSMDPRLSADRSKIIGLVKAARVDDGKNIFGEVDLSPYYNMYYSDELKQALDDLEFQIRDGAVSHGVEVPQLVHPSN